MQTKLKFYQLLQLQLNNRLQTLLKEENANNVDEVLMRKVRNMIKDNISSIFEKSKFKLSENAVIWLTDQYFKRIKVGSDRIMSDYVVLNEYKLDELTQTDVKLLRDLFYETDMGKEIDEDYKRRNVIS